MNVTQFDFAMRFDPPLCIPGHASTKIIGNAAAFFEGEYPETIKLETVLHSGELVAVGTYRLQEATPRGLYKLVSGTAYQPPASEAINRKRAEYRWILRQIGLPILAGTTMVGIMSYALLGKIKITLIELAAEIALLGAAWLYLRRKA